MTIIIDFFFSLQLTQAIRGKDEQKEICFVSLQDFKKKKLECLCPQQIPCMAGGAVEGKPSSFEMLLINYVFYLFKLFWFGVVIESCVLCLQP